MPDISKAVLDGQTITIKQNVTFQGRIHPDKKEVDRIQNDHYLPQYMADTGKYAK